MGLKKKMLIGDVELFEIKRIGMLVYLRTTHIGSAKTMLIWDGELFEIRQKDCFIYYRAVRNMYV